MKQNKPFYLFFMAVNPFPLSLMSIKWNVFIIPDY